MLREMQLPEMYIASSQFQLISPWACLIIYLAVLIVCVFIFSNIDFGRYFKKEKQSHTLGLMLTIIVSLVVTFCIGTLMIIFSSLLFTGVNAI